MRSILAGVIKSTDVSREDYLKLGYGLLSGKLLRIKYSGASLDELAFGLLHAAANPGSNPSPLTSEDASFTFEFLYSQGTQGH